MSVAETIASKHALEGGPFMPRKKFKASELPLNSAQRSSIDGLVHTIKKKGEYDTLRKQVWSQFTQSTEKKAFTDSLKEIADAEIDRDPSLLSRDRGKAATLMQGAVDRSDIYKTVEQTLDTLIAKNIDHVVKVGREIRRAEVGDEIANEEERLGRTTDEEYIRGAALKREERVKAQKQEEARKRREDQKEALRQEEAQKKKELERLRMADEKRRERDARRIERETEAERRRREAYEERREKEAVKHETADSAEKPSSPAVPPVDEKALEEAALELLLKDARERAEKDKPKVDRDISESPHRKPHVSPPKGPAADRNKPFMKHEPRLTTKLSYSSTPIFAGSPFAGPNSSSVSRRPSESSRSPYVAPNPASRHDHSRSNSHSRNRSHSIREDDSHQRTADPEPKIVLKAQTQLKHEQDPEIHRPGSRDERDDPEQRRERSTSRGTDKRSIYDEGDRDHRHASRYDHDYNRRRSSRDRDRDRDRDSERRQHHRHHDHSHRYDDRPYTRPRREEAPEHIDRYVPGGAVPRNKDRDRERDVKDRDPGARRDSRDYTRDREKNPYYDTDRDRKYYKRESGEYSSHHHHQPQRDKDRDREYGGSHRERERDRCEDRDKRYVRPRRDDKPENIDRYVPSSSGRDRERSL